MPQSRRLLACLLLTASALHSDEPRVTRVQAVHRHGQTFITWRDAAQGEAGLKYRYNVYRHGAPITPNNVAEAELYHRGVLNNSARLFGTSFNVKDRIDASKPYSVIEESAPPLPTWSGLAVVTADKKRQSYYAVVATDEKHVPLSRIVPGESATRDAIAETSAPIRPIKLLDSKERKGPYVANTSISGKRGLPMHVTLHGSQGTGGGAGEYGDYYLYFGTPEMGHRDGLPGVFTVSETRGKPEGHLVIRPRDAIEHPSGTRAMETYWLGYACVPQWAKHEEPRFYAFTEKQLLWMTRFAIERYGADPQRITMGGSSSGGVGSFNVGFRNADVFAAVYPSAARVRKVPAVALDGKYMKGFNPPLFDGKTRYYDHVDGPRFAAERHDDLPFVGWACGRQDGYATWQEQIDFVKALTESHHGFAFSWNNGNHGGGGAAMQAVSKYYPASKFARDKSYPAFGNSSINNNMGNGDPKDGDLEGGINLGFDWTGVRDEAAEWSVEISNNLAKANMTVDVTPRRTQQFKPRPGQNVRWRSSTGGEGSVVADRWGLVTVPRLVIEPGKATRLTLR